MTSTTLSKETNDKPTMKNNLITPLAVFTTLLCAGHRGDAAPYASDSFSSAQYALGTDPTGINGGTGFGSAWSFNSSGSGNSVTTVAGLSLTGYQSSGNAVRILAAQTETNTATLARLTGFDTPTNSDVWQSFLVRQDVQTSPNGFAGTFSRTQTTFGTTEGLTREYFTEVKYGFGFAPPNQFSAGIGLFKNPVAQNTSFDLTLATTFLVLSAFENINYGNFSGNTTTVSMWVLSQSDITAIGISPSLTALNANNRMKLTRSLSGSDVTFGTNAITATQNFNLFTQLGTATFDEIRLGTTLADVYSVTPGTGNTFASWISAYPGVGALTGFIDDSDADGLPNGVESLLGSDPSTSNQGLSGVSGTSSSVTFSHSRSNTIPSDVSLSYQWSSDLINWFASDATNPGGVQVNIGAVPTLDVSAPANDMVMVTATRIAGASTRLFVRLVAGQIQP